MLLYKQLVVTYLVLAGAIITLAIRVDTGKGPSISQSSSSTGGSDYLRGKESFSPGPTQNGGWHKPESAVMYGDNAWKEADLSVFGSTKDEVSRLSEGHGVNFNDGSTSVKVGQIASFSSDSGQQFNGFSGGSGAFINGGDLVVGQGSVQRPANVGVHYQKQPPFSQSSGSFPVHTQIGPEISQYSQVVSTNSKIPVASLSDFSNRPQIAGSDYRPGQNKPLQPQYFGGKPSQPSPQVFGHKISHSQSSIKYPSKPIAARPPPTYQKVTAKPVQPLQYKPDVPYISNRYPPQKPFVPNSSIRGAPKPPTQNKYPIQPSHQYPKPHPQAQISRGGFPPGSF